MNKTIILILALLVITTSIYFNINLSNTNLNTKDSNSDSENVIEHELKSDDSAKSVKEEDETTITPVVNNINTNDTVVNKNYPGIINNVNPLPQSQSQVSTQTKTPTSDPRISSAIVKPDTGDLRETLLSGEWYWIKTEKGLRPISSSTEIVVPKNQTDFLLTFSNDGNISIDTDCNSMGGTYKLDGIKLTFGPLVSTQMYCEGSVEYKFAESLKTGTVYYLSFDDAKSKMYIVSNETMYFIKK